MEQVVINSEGLMVRLKPGDVWCCFCCRTHGGAVLSSAAASLVYLSNACVRVRALSRVNKMLFCRRLIYYQSKGWMEVGEEEEWMT